MGYRTSTSESFVLKYSAVAEYDGNSNLVYFADAVPGMTTADPVWRIRKISYDGNGNFLKKEWPNGDPTFSFIWDNRGSYSYSL